MLLIVHSVVLGSGTRLFGADDEPHRLELVETTPTDAGLLLATYRTVGPDRQGRGMSWPPLAPW